MKKSVSELTAEHLHTGLSLTEVDRIGTLVLAANGAIAAVESALRATALTSDLIPSSEAIRGYADILERASRQLSRIGKTVDSGRRIGGVR
jgi:hypothetical protein